MTEAPAPIDGRTAHATLLRAVENVLDEHAELRDVLAQVGDATDGTVLAGLLSRLHGLLDAHFRREEESGGVLPLIADALAAHRDDVTRLATEHRAILRAVHDLAAEVGTDPSGSMAATETRLATILAQLHAHDVRETDLLTAAVRTARSMAIDPAAAGRVSLPVPSAALAVNLRRTAVDVVIPPEQMVLLDVTAGLHGVQQQAQKLLREINHRYVGWPATLHDLHRHAMGTFAHHAAHERAPEAVNVVCALYRKAADAAPSEAVRETALRYHLYYLGKVLGEAGPRLPVLLPVVAAALEQLRAPVLATPSVAIALSAPLRRLTRTLLAAVPDPASPPARTGLDLLGATLEHVYAGWLRIDDPVRWWHESATGASGAPVPGAVVEISHARLRQAQAALARTRGGMPNGDADARSLLTLPDDAEIARRYLEAASCLEARDRPAWKNAADRIRWLIRILSAEPLAAVHEQALREINHAYARVLADADLPAVEGLVRDTFATVRMGPLAAAPVAFDLVARIGSAVLATGERAWADVVIDEILALDFPPPGFAGFTDEWQMRVDPAHLLAIRCHLAVIKANPVLARRLLAALVVHLGIGGVLIADTDLFQRDVSTLLGSGVGPVYHQLKHLLRLFPVYFNDIGAEGELRDVSTQIDEIGGRADPLCNFLRKQCHVESNPRLLGFVEEVARFWATGDAAPLAPWVPAALAARLAVDGPRSPGLGRVVTRLVPAERLGELFMLDPVVLHSRLDAMSDVPGPERQKVELLVRLRRLIARKYELGHDDVIERLRAFHRIEQGPVEALDRALAAERYDDALEHLLGILEALKEIAIGPEPARPIEDIYHKRHIAAGIPSMYGRYRETKFEAAGLTFRLESLANALLDRMIAGQETGVVDRRTLERAAHLLRLTIRALRIDGCRARRLAATTAMLEEALTLPGVTARQYANVFQLVSQSIEQIIRVRYLDVYEPVLEPLLGRMFDRGLLRMERGNDRRETILKTSERLLRDLIARSFGLEQLDRLVGNVLRTLADEPEPATPSLAARATDWDPVRCCVPIEGRHASEDGPIRLGNKGHLITRLAREGFPVPPGFILTTDFFRCAPAIRSDDRLRGEVVGCVREHVAHLERLTGRRFGDPARPLLLSVRSGAPISMPGVLDTFLNVGMNPDVATGFARTSASPWAAWDAYRRFLQFWGMTHGIERDRFDAIMRDAKRRHLVAKKSNLAPDDMRQVAFEYRQLLDMQGVRVVDEPVEQLERCIDLVLRSWDSDKARAYRRGVKIADDWGTAVVVQAMVYGNLGPRAGTGVVLTCDPRRQDEAVELYGDFIVQGQGDDVVSGLVETFPITERQRHQEGGEAPLSLERDFPHIHDALLRHARTLVVDDGLFHQEIEFTFESDLPEDLYVLQTRDAVRTEQRVAPAFVPGPTLERARAATGIGAGGGALSGRVAHRAADIEHLRTRFPGDAIILLRPDTVPDDIPLVLQVDGMLTALGGATSHAAVAARWLGRTCVVGCRTLVVHEDLARSDLAGTTLATGDLVSIDGNDGSVYVGRHPVTGTREPRGQ